MTSIQKAIHPQKENDRSEFENINPTCGTCKRWQRIDGEAGECTALPATVAILDEGEGDEIIFIRAQMVSDERACIYFLTSQ
jgi:hypothetical protein